MSQTQGKLTFFVRYRRLSQFAFRIFGIVEWLFAWQNKINE